MPSDGEQPSTMASEITRERALKLLKSGSPHERLRGARFFAKNARSRDASILRKSRNEETDSYVLRTLELAIKRSFPVPAVEGEQISELVSEERNRRARIDAVEWIAGLLLHEIASPLGLLEEAASREVQDYKNSAVCTRIEQLQRIFEGIEQLKTATGNPSIQEFDLSSWLETTIDGESLARGIPVSLQGTRPFLIQADPKLLRFAVCNGLKNAVEAVEAQKTREAHPLIVTWGVSDSDFWIAIRDWGPGILDPPQMAFDIGKTTKQGHSGFGLPIARQAMESMDGTVTLQPGKGSGAVYELRWPKQ